MISTLVCACAIFWAFERIMRLAMVTDWDVLPLALLFIMAVVAVKIADRVHRRLT